MRPLDGPTRLRRSPRCVLATLTMLTSLALGGAPSGGQSAPRGDAGDPFSDIIEVRTVNLEVVVTDRSGQRVTGLDPGDFELFVDGQAVPIDYFSEVVAGWSADTPASEGAPQPAFAAGEPVGTSYLLYFDDNRTLKSQRDIVVENLIDQLPSLGPADRMAIVVHSGTVLTKLSDWTNDRHELRSALDRLLDGRQFGGSLKAARLFAPRSPQSRVTGPSGGTYASTRYDRAFAEGADTALGAGSRLDRFQESTLGRIDLELAVTAAISAMRGFYASDVGRRVMVMAGGDWPIGAFPTRTGEVGTISDLDMLRILVDTANLLGYTLYPVGLTSNNLWANANLGYIAKRTGGRPLFERTTVLADATDDTRSYYWLGFTPSFERDDRPHEIEVRVKRPGLRVRSRSGYLDLSQSTRLEMAAQGALFFGDDSVTESVTLETGEPERFRLRKMKVPLDIHIPAERLAFLPDAGGETASLEVRFVVIDASGYQTDEIPALPLSIARHDLTEGEDHVFSTWLLMRRRPHELVVSVYDQGSGQTLFGRALIEP